MKYLRCVLTILLTFVILLTCILQISAIDTGFATEEMPQDTRENFLKNIAVTLITEEPQKKAFECFAVNEEGLVALGRDVSAFSTKSMICVYTSEGDFLYGYEFNCSGSFSLEFSGDTVIIYFVRSAAVVSVDSRGNIAGAAAVPYTRENNSYANSLGRSVRSVGDTQYRIKNDIGILGLFAVSYGQVAVTEAGGEERIIYDVNDAQFIKAILIILFVLLLLCVVVFGITKTVLDAQKPEVREKYDMENIIEILENKFKRK